MAVTRELLDGKVWASDLVGTPADLDKPSDAIISAGWAPQGAKPIRQYHNWLINALASNIAFFENEGFFEWDPNITYEPNAIVIASNGAHYVGKTAANLGNDPTTDGGVNWDLLTNFLFPADSSVVRPKFVHKGPGTSDIDMYGRASYYTQKGRVGWSGNINYTFTTLSNGVISYLYIDESTISGPGIITAANFIDSQTAPSYYPLRGGWYDGEDKKCIFAVTGVTGTYNIVPFYHNGDEDIFIVNNNQFTAGFAVPTGTGVTVNYAAPEFTRAIRANLEYSQASGLPTVLNGAPSDNLGVLSRFLTCNNGIAGGSECIDVFMPCGPSGGVYFVAGVNTGSLITGLQGWRLGKGM